MRPADPYAVLGLGPDATEDEVKRAYRNLSRRYHPDTAEIADDDNTEAFIRITRAYHAIVDGEQTTLPVGPVAPAPANSEMRPRRRLFGPRLPLRAVLGLALLAGVLVAACLAISEIYARRVMLRALHDGGVAFVPPAVVRKQNREEPAALTFAERMRREREAAGVAQKKGEGGKQVVAATPTPRAISTSPPVISTSPPVISTSPPVISTSPPVISTSPPVISTAGRDLPQPSSAAGNDRSRDNERFFAGARNDKGGNVAPPLLPAASLQPTPPVAWPFFPAVATPTLSAIAAVSPAVATPTPSAIAAVSPAVASTSPPVASTSPPAISTSPPVISTAGRDLPQPSSAAGNDRSHDNRRLFAGSRNDIGEKRNGSGDAREMPLIKQEKPAPESPKIQTAKTPKPEPPMRHQEAETTSPSPPAVAAKPVAPTAAATPAVAATKPVASPAAAAQPASTVVAAKPGAAAPVPPPAPAPAQPTEAQLQQRLDRFLAAYCQAYGARELNAFKRYFTAEATENGTPVSDLMPTYSKLFASTEKLALRITTLRWQQSANGRIDLDGRFTIDLDYRDAGPVHGSGRIDFQLAYDDTVFHIQKMKYSFDR